MRRASVSLVISIMEILMVDSASITHVILSDKKTCQKSHTEVVIFVEFVEESGVNFFLF